MNFEVIGLIASVFVLISFVPKNIKLIRIINSVGCIIWITYGLLTGALSVWIMNLILLGVQIVHLIKDRK